MVSHLKANIMKKISVVIAAMSCFSAGLNGQTTPTDIQAGNQSLVCKPIQGKSDVSCYKSNYAENFKVCKNENGYYICSGIPSFQNKFNSLVIDFKKTSKSLSCNSQFWTIAEFF